MKDVEIGVVAAPSGIRGEIRVKSYADDPSRFSKIKEIALVKDGKATEYTIERARISGAMPVLKLSGVDDRNAAELLRSSEIFMDRDDLEPLEEGEHYIRDLIGLKVRDADSGEVYGTLKEVLTDRPQDLYVVSRTSGGEFMIPGVPEFIRSVSEEDGVIDVRVIEGMLGDK